jgi:hypothetical protein
MQGPVTRCERKPKQGNGMHQLIKCCELKVLNKFYLINQACKAMRGIGPCGHAYRTKKPCRDQKKPCPGK